LNERGRLGDLLVFARVRHGRRLGHGFDVADVAHEQSLCSSVENVMLEHEENVEEDGEEAEAEFCRVTEDRTPIIVVVRDDEHLSHTESSSGEVKQDVPDAPAGGRLAAIVHNSLGNVLDERDEEFDVRAHVQKVYPLEERRESEADRHSEKDSDGCADDPTRHRHRLTSSLVNETLKHGEGRDEGGVDGEQEIVQLDRVDAVRVAVEVLHLNRMNAVKAKVEY